MEIIAHLNDGSKLQLSTTMPIPYTNCLDFYLFDLDIPTFYPDAGAYGHSTANLAIVNLILQTPGLTSSHPNLLVTYPAILVDVQILQVNYIQWTLPQRNRCYSMYIIPAPKEFDNVYLSSKCDDLKWTYKQPIITEKSVDLRPICSPIFDQGDLGTCGIASMVTLIEMARKQRYSVLFLYWTTRVEIAGVTPCYDWGSETHLVQEALYKFGLCTSTTWPYNTLLYATRPPEQAWKEAQQIQFYPDEFVALNSVEDMKQCLREGHAFNMDGCLSGLSYDRKTAATGIVPMPRPDEVISLITNEHAFTVVGFDDEKQHLLFQQSWGQWGDNGFGYLPYDFIKPGLWRNAYTYIPRGVESSLRVIASS